MADKTHLQVDLGVIQEVGQRAAVVLAIISDGCDKEGTTSMTHAEVARRAGIAHISARRAINKLRNVGLLKSEPRYQDNWQRANLYWVLTAGQFVGPAHSEQANIYINTSSIYESLVHKREIAEVVPVPAIPQVSGARRAPWGTGTSPTEVETPASGGVSQVVEGEPEIIWMSPDSPMPVRSSGGFRKLIEIEREAQWLTVTFEWMVLDHESRYRRALGRRRRETVGDSRKRKFLKTSRAWLSESDAPPLAEICEVACWVFEECDGRFPFEAINPWSGKADEKLTSIVQLRWHYECLRSAMAMRDTDPARYTSTSPRVSVNAPPRDVQAEVDGLVEQFVKFRGRIASDSLRRNCADTFRIMLTRDKIGLEDIETVLANLAWVGTQVGIDLRLYQDTAFPLRRDFKRIHQKVVDALGERSASGAADRGDNA